MTLENKLADLKTVLAADIFTIPTGSYQQTPVQLQREEAQLSFVISLRKLLRRDKEEIRRRKDGTNNHYRLALRDWLNFAGKYLQQQGTEINVIRFNSAYERLLAFYGGKLIDEIISKDGVISEISFPVQQAHSRCGLYEKLAEKNRESYAQGIQHCT